MTSIPSQVLERAKAMTPGAMALVAPEKHKLSRPLVLLRQLDREMCLTPESVAHMMVAEVQVAVVHILVCLLRLENDFDRIYMERLNVCAGEDKRRAQLIGDRFTVVCVSDNFFNHFDVHQDGVADWRKRILRSLDDVECWTSEAYAASVESLHAQIRTPRMLWDAIQTHGPFLRLKDTGPPPGA